LTKTDSQAWREVMQKARTGLELLLYTVAQHVKQNSPVIVLGRLLRFLRDNKLFSSIHETAFRVPPCLCKQTTRERSSLSFMQDLSPVTDDKLESDQYGSHTSQPPLNHSHATQRSRHRLGRVHKARCTGRSPTSVHRDPCASQRIPAMSPFRPW